MTEIYNADEILKHNHRESCWLIAHGKVYDVTDWLAQHFAQEQSILKYAGTDCTQHFDFHSSSARKLWAQYQIGYLNGYTHCILL